MSASVFLYKKNRPVSKLTQLLLLVSIALGIAALVTLEKFSIRIKQTVLTDSKALLTADLQIRSRRPFESKVKDHLLSLGLNTDQIILQTEFITSIVLPDKQVTTAMLRAVEGSYPFYGNLKITNNKKVSDLAEFPSLFADQNLLKLGFSVNDIVKIGNTDFKILGFIEEEPQALASVFAVGPRIIIHQKHLANTGLSDIYSRAFHSFLVKTNINPKDFQKNFRALVPEPHIRIQIPERASLQTANVLDRLSGFLSLVGICALLLGSIGIFSIYRSQLLQRLSYDLTLRCLGFKRKDLLVSYSLQAIENAFIGWILGFVFGSFIEHTLVNYAQSALDIKLAKISYWDSAIFSAMITLMAVFLAILPPVIETLKTSVSEAIRTQQLKKNNFNLPQYLLLFGIASFLIFWIVAFQWKMAITFIVAIPILTFITNYFSLLLLKFFRPWLSKVHFIVKLTSTELFRTWKQARVSVASISISVFIVLTILNVGATLREQIDLSSRSQIPNLALLGIELNQKEDLSSKIQSLTFVPVLQARLLNINNTEITEENIENSDEDDRRFLTREYTITKRDTLTDAESLAEGTQLFSNSKNGIIRLSLEKRFADRINLSLGDSLTISIAGVPLNARVDSLRTVDWWNFQPNFFIVANPQDLEGAPFNFVAHARIKDNELSNTQSLVKTNYPNITVINGNSLALKITTMLENFSFAVLSLGIFSVLACIFVFSGIILSQKPERLNNIALLKAMGFRNKLIILRLSLEPIFLCFIASISAATLSILSTALICKFVLDIYFTIPELHLLISTVFLLPIIITTLTLLVSWNDLRKSPADVLRWMTT